MNSSGISDTEAIARSAFAEIAKRFPELKMLENSGEPVEISITIPVQPGLSYHVWLSLQNHERASFFGRAFLDVMVPMYEARSRGQISRCGDRFLVGEISDC